ncbi:MAG: response regulator [Roseburia sp.]
MKKVLLIGESNKTVSNLNRYLAGKFQTQMCADKLELIEGMVKISAPDLILVCLAGVGQLDLAILEFFRGMNGKTPVLLVGTSEECGCYEGYYGEEQFSFVVRPITQSELLKKCSKALGLETEEQDWNEWYAGIEERVRKQILIVDDSALAVRSIKSMLDKKYDIAVAMSGEKAVPLAKKELPDLILLDYEMPGWDGKKTLEELRNDEEVMDTPVIFLTGVADKEHISAVLGMHPAAYLLKPVERNKLLDTIAEVLGE